MYFTLSTRFLQQTFYTQKCACSTKLDIKFGMKNYVPSIKKAPASKLPFTQILLDHSLHRIASAVQNKKYQMKKTSILCQYQLAFQTPLAIKYKIATSLSVTTCLSRVSFSQVRGQFEDSCYCV